MALLGDLQHRQSEQFVSAYMWTLVYAGLHENDRAFAWLARPVDDHDEGLAFVRRDPGLDPLRSDPRFADVLRKVGFAPVATNTQ